MATCPAAIGGNRATSQRNRWSGVAAPRSSGGPGNRNEGGIDGPAGHQNQPQGRPRVRAGAPTRRPEGRHRGRHGERSALGRKASRHFSFETLQHGGQPVEISTEIRAFRNSKGQAEVDEEGRVIRRGGGNTGKAVAGTAAGGLIGGIAGGWKGAAIGTGVGAAASIAVIEIACDSPEIRFDPGSVITLSAKSRGGPALSSLTGAPATQARVSQPAPSYAATPNTSAGVPAAPAATVPAANPAAAQ